MKIIVNVDDERYARAHEFADAGMNDTDLLCEALQELFGLGRPAV
jgi:hypothetical protein